MKNVHVVCPGCDAVLRVPADRLGEGPRCARCKAALFTGRPIDLNGPVFDVHAARSDLPLLVDFWAPWCGPCHAMAPHFASAARRLEPRYRLARVNTEDCPDLAARFDIRSIPTLILFRGGRVVARQAGAMDGTALERWLAAADRG